MIVEKIQFENSNHEKLVGALHTSRDQTKRAVVIAHGFTSGKDRGRHEKMASSLAENGIAAMRFDFGGCGESEERPISIRAQIDDLHSAVKLLKEHGYQVVGVLGESLGGLTALCGYHDLISAMVLWAPVTKEGPLFIDRFNDEQKNELLKKGWFAFEKRGRMYKIPQEYVDERTHLYRDEVLKRVKIPVLIVHGTGDEIVPIENSREAIQLLPSGSKLVEIENWGHGDQVMEKNIENIIQLSLDWFKEHLPS